MPRPPPPPDSQATEVSRTVTALEQVVAEHSDAVTVAAVVRNGFSLQLASLMLGRPVMSELHTAWIATDRSIAPLPPSLTSHIRPQLTVVRKRDEQGQFPFDAVERRLRLRRGATC